MTVFVKVSLVQRQQEPKILEEHKISKIDLPTNQTARLSRQYLSKMIFFFSKQGSSLTSASGRGAGIVSKVLNLIK